jgi:hypothetical protein
MTSPDSRHSTLRRRWLPFLLLAVVVGLVLSTVPVRGLSGTSYAAASDDQVCWVSSGVCSESYDPPNLLGPDAYAAMTSDQAVALHSLEGQAVSEVLATHELPASDRLAVRTWGRTDAQAALWGLLVEAIKTPVSERTSVQQEAVDWITGQVRQLSVSTAEQTGAEYASWAGLDLQRYWQLVHPGGGQTAQGNVLAAFLSQTPSPYDDPDTSQAKAGFCRFRPPSPYQGDYSASDSPQCYAPCASPFGCTPDTPDFDTFVTWGTATAQGQQFSSPGFATQAWKLKAAVLFGSTAVGAGVAAAAGVGAGVWASLVLGSATMVGAMVESELLATWAILFGVDAMAFDAAFAGGMSGAAFAAGAAAVVAGVVMVVVAAVVTAVLEGMKVDKGAKVPVQIATMVVSTQQSSTDVAALLDTSEGATAIYSLFVKATLPMARPDLACDDTDPRVGPVCLHAPAVAAPKTDDPQLLVDGKIAPTLTLAGPTPDLWRTVRVTGDWFVQKLPSVSQEEAQTLSLGYTDAQGSPQQAWLHRTPSGEYRFVGSALDQEVDPDTCKSDGTCWDSPTLRYLGADGQAHEARLEVPAPPVGAPSYGANPVEGQVAMLKANGFAPAHAVGTVTYGWQFEVAGCGTMDCTSTYTRSIAGATVGYTWSTSGSYEARLTAVDSEGRTATTTLMVPVAAVPPVLALDPGSSTQVSTGQQATIVASLDYAGTLDDETVTVDWGDGTPQVTSGRGPNLVFLATPDLHVRYIVKGGDTTLSAVTGTHVYSQRGTFQVRIVATNQAGQTDHLTHTVVVS